jgi:hypothetical protein
MNIGSKPTNISYIPRLTDEVTREYNPNEYNFSQLTEEYMVIHSLFN